MESRLNKKAEKHIQEFKNAIKDWFLENNSNVIGDCNTSEFLKFIYDFDTLNFNKDDLQKRKRIKNVVPSVERCIALRANMEQCTRRKKDGCEYCGTHEKGVPYGVIQTELSSEVCQPCKKLEVWIQEIKGIYYYIDDFGNVYKHDDIIQNKKDPSVLAKYRKTEDGTYSIPEFSI
tara:strand:+ start:6120 stop:6647 length:528 start_codon:yes stop_codon:yes gene_type:complete